MRRIKKTILLVTLFFNVIHGSTREHVNRYFREIESGMVTYLLSYPRSGNSLLRYLIEFTTKRPTLAFQLTDDKLNLPLGMHFSELQTNLYAKPIWKVHAGQKIIDQPHYSLDRTRIILVIRNYKENIFRESQVWGLRLFDSKGNLNEGNLRALFSWYCRQNKKCTFDPDYQQYGNTSTQLYFDNIYLYDQLPNENKLLIYYEDLIQNPENELYKICAFFDCSQDHIAVLMKDYDKYKNRMLAFYPANQTTGTEKVYYSTRYSDEQRKQVDDYVKQHYPGLWDTYLKRYEEA